MNRAKEKKQPESPVYICSQCGQGDKRGPCIYQDQAADGVAHTLRMHAGEA